MGTGIHARKTCGRWGGSQSCFYMLPAVHGCSWACYCVQSVPVVWELLGLFVAFAKEEAQRGDPGAVRTQVVAPNALREALSDLDAHLFSIGEPLPLQADNRKISRDRWDPRAVDS